MVFVKANGKDILEKWLDDEGAGAEEALDAMIKRLSPLRREVWGSRFVHKIEGQKDIYELIISTGDKQYRPLGCFGPGQREFTILIGASKKGGRKRRPMRWDPPNALKTAKKRCKLVINNRGLLREYQTRTGSTKKTSSE